VTPTTKGPERDSGARSSEVLGSALPKFLMAAGVAMLVGVGLYAHYVGSSPAARASEGARRGPFIVNLTITPGAGPDGTWPAYVPSTINVPAYALVEIRVVNLDDATSIPQPYNQVKGTVGGVESIAPLDLGNPNHPGKTSVVRSLKPADVAHTFTILSLGISVPIDPKSVTTFEMRTGAPGVYAWRCFDPCGYGTTGWNGAMATTGFMEGTFVVR
jgi:hypothetical protein